jgi:hypothetical protein
LVESRQVHHRKRKGNDLLQVTDKSINFQGKVLILGHQISGGHPYLRELELIPDDHTEFQRKIIKI